MVNQENKQINKKDAPDRIKRTERGSRDNAAELLCTGDVQ